MPSPVFAPKNVTTPMTTKAVVVVQVAQLTQLSPAELPEEMGSLRTVILDTTSLDKQMMETEINRTSSSTKRGTNEANVRRSRSPSSRPQRSTSVGVSEQDGNRIDGSPHRRDTGLRLPSFRGLGISSLEPNYLNRARHTESQQRSPQSFAQSQRSPLRPRLRPSTNYQHTSDQFPGTSPLLTPPEDTDSIKWNNALQVSPLPGPSLCEQCHTPIKPTNAMNNMPVSGSTSTSSSHSLEQSNRPNQTVPVNIATDRQSDTNNGGSESWLDRAVEKAVSSVVKATAQHGTVNVVAHVLPLPAEDASPHHDVFTSVIQAVQERFPSDNQPYITITHAVPNKFDLNSLPTSPPATPNLFNSGGDYFSPSVFAHAAVVPSYNNSASNRHGSSTTSSPTRIVPPSSIQMSIIERYIPPTSIRENKELFSTNGRSVLVDRLSEVSSNNGTLLFIYPTKTGAKTFSSRYLAVLNPILMNVVNLNGLVFNLAEDIGNMLAIPEMDNFEGMKAKIQTVCERMSGASQFQIVHSGKGSVRLDEATWREWYIEQEHARIRDVLRAYWKQGRRLPGDTEVTDATIARSIIDGLRKGVRGARPAAGVGVEVGVFVIRRTPASA